jgi:hypothetical protein
VCKRIVCPNCNKPSYVGSGAHIEQVLKDVPVEKRCHCKEEIDDDEDVISYRVTLP